MRSGNRFVLVYVALTASLLLGRPALCYAQQDSDQERLAKVQAVFVLNFARYTTWPQDAFNDAQSPLVITALGRPRLLPYLRRVVAEEELGDGRRIELRRLDYPEPDEGAEGKGDQDAEAEARAAFIESLRRSHLVYIATADVDRVPQVIRELGGADVLTVSGARGFIEAGGMLELRRRYERVTFAANLDAINATRLQVSSKLLRLAEWVKGGE